MTCSRVVKLPDGTIVTEVEVTIFGASETQLMYAYYPRVDISKYKTNYWGKIENTTETSE